MAGGLKIFAGIGAFFRDLFTPDPLDEIAKKRRQTKKLERQKMEQSLKRLSRKAKQGRS